MPNNAELSLFGVVPISGFKIPYLGPIRKASLLGTFFCCPVRVVACSLCGRISIGLTGVRWV